MVILNMFGKIEPICISQKMKLYISNLPMVMKIIGTRTSLMSLNMH